MKQIRLILEDFEQLPNGKWLDKYQFTSNRDCPIARAVRRRFPKKRVYVMTYKVEVGDKDYYFKEGEGMRDNLKEKFSQLKGGKKYAIIKLA
tara:strand:- start:199 stop:474 length:276 start_codon:yes stop_codon:yes gene_type:complete